MGLRKINVLFFIKTFVKRKFVDANKMDKVFHSSKFPLAQNNFHYEKLISVRNFSLTAPNRTNLNRSTWNSIWINKEKKSKMKNLIKINYRLPLWLKLLRIENRVRHMKENPICGNRDFTIIRFPQANRISYFPFSILVGSPNIKVVLDRNHQHYIICWKYFSLN